MDFDLESALTNLTGALESVLPKDYKLGFETRWLIREFLTNIANALDGSPEVKFTLDEDIWPDPYERLRLGLAPSYKTHGSVGADLRSAENCVVAAHARRAVRTGLHIQLPPGYECQVRPRSGYAKDYGVTLSNSPGTVDEDFRGQLLVLIENHGDLSFEVTRGQRIAQLVVARYVQARWVEVDKLSETGRGQDGFGSTGAT